MSRKIAIPIIVMLDFITGLVMDGFLPVFKTLLGFLPTVVVLLCLVGIFENCGWVMCFGCNTLGVSTMQSHDKRMLNFMTFIPCSAKLPVMMFLIGTVLGMTIFGVVFLYVLAVFVGLVLGGNKNIQCPRIKRLSVWGWMMLVTLNVWQFLQRISIGLCLAVATLYTLQYFGWLEGFAKILLPIFAPIGIDNVAIVIALCFGLVAKEMIIGALVGFGLVGMSIASGLALCLFAVLYTPCLPTLLAIKKKFGAVQMWKSAVLHFAVAWVLSLALYNILVLI